MSKQFVEVKFQNNSTRRYTYHDENSPPLAVGDRGDVETDRGIVTVEVTRVGLAAPEFATRPIKRLSTPAPEAPAPAPASPPPQPAEKERQAPRLKAANKADREPTAGAKESAKPAETKAQ